MYQPSKYYNPEIQVAAMKRRYPQFHDVKKKKGEIDFTGIIKVSLVLPAYTIVVTYRGDLRPLVRVVSPVLVPDRPHFHEVNNSLCLYHPKNFNWTRDKLVAQYIISWAAAWIYFYEVWLVSKIWYGPEADHKDELLKLETI